MAQKSGHSAARIEETIATHVASGQLDQGFGYGAEFGNYAWPLSNPIEFD